MAKNIAADKKNGVYGKIPIKNIWLLMLYASDLYKHMSDTHRMDIEENLDDIADLVAEILCHHVEERLMRQLSYGTISKVDVINRVRGRIDLLTTKRHRLLEKGKICCKFDDLTMNTPRNQYVCAALETLTKFNINKNLSQKCKSLIQRLTKLGVSNVKPYGYSGKSQHFTYNDNYDQKMIAAADFAFSLILPNQLDGHVILSSPYDKIEWLRKLFKQAIFGFYRVNLKRKKYQVIAGKWLDWIISNSSKNIDEILPKMKTDIIVSDIKFNKHLIIDTKFNEITTASLYRKEALRSGYIYQIYTYIHSQNIDDSIGMLLHPTIDKEVKEYAIIQNHAIWFCTINLNQEAFLIKERLNEIINMVFRTT